MREADLGVCEEEDHLRALHPRDLVSYLVFQSLSLRITFWDFGFRDLGAGFRIEALGSRVKGSEFGV